MALMNAPTDARLGRLASNLLAHQTADILQNHSRLRTICTFELFFFFRQSINLNMIVPLFHKQQFQRLRYSFSKSRSRSLADKPIYASS
ncbi:hypothetical protein VTO42DRAFT_8424 [Malbranchea cinnamomea]